MANERGGALRRGGITTDEFAAKRVELLTRV
jgi:hypothetical protein